MNDRNFWIARITDVQAPGSKYYWEIAQEEQAWLTYLRYEETPKRAGAVTQTLNIIKQVKAGDILLLTTRKNGLSVIDAYGEVVKCPYGMNTGISVDNIKDKIPEETIVHYVGSDVFYGQLKAGLACWPQRIKVKEWMHLNKETTTEGIKRYKTNGSVRLSFFGVPREFAKYKLGEDVFNAL